MTARRYAYVDLHRQASADMPDLCAVAERALREQWAGPDGVRWLAVAPGVGPWAWADWTPGEPLPSWATHARCLIGWRGWWPR